MHTKFWKENLKGIDQLKITRHKCEDNIKMNLKDEGWEGVDWIHLAQG
jgi:hypothetical protein